ncbi:MAG: hypothetical protein R3240_05190, partial [Gammaproteobacteria bacterium]|nr:hypothetical protein [Gammaproteobacteria bacterium]
MHPFLDLTTVQRLTNTIENTPPRPHHGTLLLVLAKLFPNNQFRHVLSVGGWHHSGGVLSADGDFLSRDMEAWLDSELAKYNDDFKQFVEHYADAGLLVTRHTGQTHYFTAAYGSAPEEFLQLEVEELHEVMDRQLIDPENPPEDYQELVAPDHYTKLDAQPVGNPRYRFVRVVDMRRVLARQSSHDGKLSPLARFMEEWSQSRAADKSHFCEHWVITGLEHYDSAENTPFTATPVSTHKRSLKPFQWDMSKVGVNLANQIQDFDRAASYPGAWYFHFVAGELVP